MLIKFDFSSKTGILVVKFAFAAANLKIETLGMGRRFARVLYRGLAKVIYTSLWTTRHYHSRPQRPWSLRSAPRITASSIWPGPIFSACAENLNRSLKQSCLFPRAHDPCGLRQGSRALARLNFLSMRRVVSRNGLLFRLNISR